MTYHFSGLGQAETRDAPPEEYYGTTYDVPPAPTPAPPPPRLCRRPGTWLYEPGRRRCPR